MPVCLRDVGDTDWLYLADATIARLVKIDRVERKFLASVIAEDRLVKR